MMDTEDPAGTCHLCLQDFPIKDTILLRCVDGCSVCICQACGPTALRFGKCMFCHVILDSVLDPLSKRPLEDPGHPPATLCMYAGLAAFLIHLLTLYALQRSFLIE